MADMTPMRKQYKEIKKQHEDCLLFFRLGDFYEMFDEDAITASRELELALTTRDRGKPEDEQTPMCGVPYHSCEAYIARLIAKGYKVAICEQLEDPRSVKGLVKRGVVRIITPGTVTESSMLEENRSNYIAAVYIDGQRGGAAFCDISTGEFCLAAFDSSAEGHILNELGRFSPREAVLSEGAAACGAVTEFLQLKLGCITEPDGGRFDLEGARERLRSQFGEEAEGCAPEALRAAGALIGYISETQHSRLEHIRRIDVYTDGRFMELDYATQRNLELIENLHGELSDTLLSVLDSALTPMGRRTLRSWVIRPLTSPTAIRERLASVRELHGDNVLRGELRSALGRIGDMQRITGRTVYGTVNARDLRALGGYMQALPRIIELTAGCSAALLKKVNAMPRLDDVAARITGTLCDDPPFSVREGGMIRSGVSEELDRLRDMRDNGSRLISELEQRERERTGIKKLRVGYNKVFGYYIDVPRSAGQDGLPDDYIRKQTLVSNERYITNELKELENSLLTARDRIGELEYDMFTELRAYVAARVDDISAAAEEVAVLDTLCSFAEAAVRNGYCEPQVGFTGRIDIVDGRHPVVERAQSDRRFVPNDVHLGGESGRVAIITGPNMAGKSTYMRQTALIVLMAQMGSFVPARSADIGVVDRVFTRIGASDDLASGQSTFMVEMNEVAHILANATADSLLILDEIGRGTSTYDGMAIARAVLEYCADVKKLGAKTMFATHYHELSELEGVVEGVRNYNITAKKQGGGLIFLRKIVPGAADDSYGIEVAKLAGVPETVIRAARRYLGELESQGAAAAPHEKPGADPGQVSFGDITGSAIAEKLRKAQLDVMTPIEALNLLYQLKKEAETGS